MNRTKKRKFNRPVATREYRKVFTIFPEGEKTENSYFTILRGMVEAISIVLIENVFNGRKLIINTIWQ